MIELLLALFFKFWMFLFGLIRGVISAVPFLRRWLLSGDLELSLQDDRLILRAGKRDLLMVRLQVFAMSATQILPVCDEDFLLAAGQSRSIELPEASHACVLMTELVDLKSGRRTRVHRRLDADPKGTTCEQITS